MYSDVMFFFCKEDSSVSEWINLCMEAQTKHQINWNKGQQMKWNNFDHKCVAMATVIHLYCASDPFTLSTAFEKPLLHNQGSFYRGIAWQLCMVLFKFTVSVKMNTKRGPALIWMPSKGSIQCAFWSNKFFSPPQKTLHHIKLTYCRIKLQLTSMWH